MKIFRLIILKRLLTTTKRAYSCIQMSRISDKDMAYTYAVRHSRLQLTWFGSILSRVAWGAFICNVRLLTSSLPVGIFHCFQANMYKQ